MASLRVHARDLQDAAGLSDGQLRHALRVAGPRYDAASGVLRLTCRKFDAAEDNRRWCYDALLALAAEARAFAAAPDALAPPPPPKPKREAAPAPKKAAPKRATKAAKA
jgi:hypothetical protein